MKLCFQHIKDNNLSPYWRTFLFQQFKLLLLLLYAYSRRTTSEEQVLMDQSNIRIFWWILRTICQRQQFKWSLSVKLLLILMSLKTDESCCSSIKEQTKTDGVLCPEFYWKDKLYPVCYWQREDLRLALSYWLHTDPGHFPSVSEITAHRRSVNMRRY